MKYNTKISINKFYPSYTIALDKAVINMKNISNFEVIVEK